MIPRSTNYLACVLIALAATTASAMAAESAMKSIEIVDRKTQKPLVKVSIEITSQVSVNCVRAPCPPHSLQKWQGTTDEHGMLAYPATLEGNFSVVYAHVVGSDFWGDLLGGRVDHGGHPMLKLQRAPEEKKP